MPHVGFEPRISRGAWIFVCRECRVLSDRGLCGELITRPEESYRMCCVVVCDLETSRIGAPYIYDISHLRVKIVPAFTQCTFLCFNEALAFRHVFVSVLPLWEPRLLHFSSSISIAPTLQLRTPATVLSLNSVCHLSSWYMRTADGYSKYSGCRTRG
jgi:hypothetical protein